MAKSPWFKKKIVVLLQTIWVIFYSMTLILVVFIGYSMYDMELMALRINYCKVCSSLSNKMAEYWHGATLHIHSDISG